MTACRSAAPLGVRVERADRHHRVRGVAQGDLPALFAGTIKFPLTSGLSIASGQERKRPRHDFSHFGPVPRWLSLAPI